MSSWATVWEAYRRHLVSQGRAPGTVTRRQWELQRFFGFCQAQGLELGQVSPETVRAYHLSLLREPGRQGRLWGESLVISALRSLQNFFDWAVEGRRVLLHPGPEVKLKEPPPPLLRVLTVAEMAALLEVPDSTTPIGLRDQAILELLYSTGLRRRECHQLDLADLDLAAGQLRVRRGKGGKFRLLPVGAQLAEVVARYLQESRPRLRPFPEETALFVSSQSGRRLGYKSLLVLVERYAQTLGLEASVHSLRHAFASHLLEGGADLRHVQELLGHRQVSTTERYTHLQPLELVREHRHCHPRGRKKP